MRKRQTIILNYKELNLLKEEVKFAWRQIKGREGILIDADWRWMAMLKSDQPLDAGECTRRCWRQLRHQVRRFSFSTKKERPNRYNDRWKWWCRDGSNRYRNAASALGAHGFFSSFVTWMLSALHQQAIHLPTVFTTNFSPNFCFLQKKESIFLMVALSKRCCNWLTVIL